jgi:hypothetical protein
MKPLERWKTLASRLVKTVPTLDKVPSPVEDVRLELQEELQ